MRKSYPYQRQRGSVPLVLFDNLERLTPDQEERLRQEQEDRLEELIPKASPLFGLFVLSFIAWDLVADPSNAFMSAVVRMLFVGLGVLGYRKNGLPWSPSQRAAFTYCMHTFGITVSAYIIRDGLRYEEVGIIVGMYVLAVLMPTTASFMYAVSLPLVLFVALTAIALPPFEAINDILFYCLSIGIALSVLRIVHFLRVKAFLLEDELARRAHYDSLTGLINRGYLTEIAEREIAAARRYNRALSIAMVDIDRFKVINDTYGHDIGDQVLKALADTCLKAVRETDYVGRFGGEEFVCILPDTGEAEAMTCGERLREQVAELRVDTPKGTVQLTISVGVAVFSALHPDWSSLLKDSDNALYRAKQEGRNRVCLAAPQAGS